ncbi:MAG: hypothetical protein V2A76_00110 [Planctomycetota bacterium]
MKNWTLLLGLGLIVVLVALDRTRAELLAGAVGRFLPHEVTGQLAYRFDEPRGLARYIEEFGESALDPERSSVERLGAAELYWICAWLAGDGFEGERFEHHLELLLDVSMDLEEEPAATALVVDVVRAHRSVLGPLDGRQEAEERLLVREVLRLARSHDPNNGFLDLIAAEVALFEGRIEEARDSLLMAARAPYVDSKLRPRSVAAYAFLRGRGLLDLEAREFLLEDAYFGRGLSSGETLENVAHELGRIDAVEVSGIPGSSPGSDGWMETFLAIHGTGIKLLNSELLVRDGRQAVEAEESYLQALAAGLPPGNSSIPRSANPGPSGWLLWQRLVGAGYTEGAATLESDREFVRAALDPSYRSGPARRRASLGSDQVVRATAAHAIFLPWIAVSLALSLLLLPAAARARRRKVPTPSSPGIFVIAALTPAGLLVYLGSRGLYPFHHMSGVMDLEPAGGVVWEASAVGDWLAVLAQPSPVLFLLPLVAAVVILLPHLVNARFRSFGSVSRRLSGFFLAYAVLLFLAFAACAPLLGDRRQARLDSLSSRVVALPGQPEWPWQKSES